MTGGCDWKGSKDTFTFSSSLLWISSRFVYKTLIRALLPLTNAYYKDLNIQCYLVSYALGKTFKCKGRCTLPECCSLPRSSKENPHDVCMTALLTVCVWLPVCSSAGPQHTPYSCSGNLRALSKFLLFLSVWRFPFFWLFVVSVSIDYNFICGLNWQHLQTQLQFLVINILISLLFKSVYL